MELTLSLSCSETMRKLTAEDKRICSACDSETTYLQNGSPKWHKNGDEKWLCSKCYAKYIMYPNSDPIRRALAYKKNNPIFNARYSGRILTFKGKAILLKQNPKTGQCSKCGKKIGDHYINRWRKDAIIKRTSIHHLEYHEGDPLKDTIELCNHCHTQVHEAWKKTKTWAISNRLLMSCSSEE